GFIGDRKLQGFSPKHTKPCNSKRMKPKVDHPKSMRREVFRADWLTPALALATQATAARALEHALIIRFGTLGRVDREFPPRSDNCVRHRSRSDGTFDRSFLTNRHYTALIRSYGRARAPNPAMDLQRQVPEHEDRWEKTRTKTENSRAYFTSAPVKIENITHQG
ncbi:hypothetical protein, partial [Paracoccus aestuariivivens]|uniref:hypothetical protein n=1 Tax=Paracoccus aestuariivivens TaxID=1820333 RepID=UPI001B8D22E9